MKYNVHNRITSIAVTLLGGTAMLLFFLLILPYHLRHREQTMLFLNNWDWICEQYLTQRHGGPVRLAGDWLQQWFYYIGAGPAIVTALLLILGYEVFRLLGYEGFRFLGYEVIKFLGYLLAIAVVLWEAGRECLPEYPVASTLQVIGWIALLLLVVRMRGWLRRGVVAVLALVVGCWALDYEPLPNTRAWGKPNLALEHQFALDVEASFGNWRRVELLAQEGKGDYNVEIYYRNLAWAQRGVLADSLLAHTQNGTEGLLIPVNDQGNYFLFAAAGEAWWALDDLTMAEHATLLGLIFSPRHTGSRCLRRLAEINLKNGDTAAAEKYLRLLRQSPVHHQWAKRQGINAKTDATHIGNEPTPSGNADTLRLQGENQLCLRGLLDANPNNLLARQYLLCYDLMALDLIGFAADVEHYGCPTGIRAYEEAMLVIMTNRPELRESWQPMVREATYRDFLVFNEAIEQSGGRLAPLASRFGHSYWYYLQCAAKK